eukprot:TCONS_00032825-protein
MLSIVCSLCLFSLIFQVEADAVIRKGGQWEEWRCGKCGPKVDPSKYVACKRRCFVNGDVVPDYHCDGWGEKFVKCAPNNRDTTKACMECKWPTPCSDDQAFGDLEGICRNPIVQKTRCGNIPSNNGFYIACASPAWCMPCATPQCLHGTF